MNSDLWIDGASAEGLEANIARWFRFVGARRGQWEELQALGAKNGRGSVTKFAHVDNVADATRLLAEMERHGAMGSFVIANRIADAVSTRAVRGQWHVAEKNGSTVDADIVRRRDVPMDVDVQRPKMTSATDAEILEADLVARRVRDRLAHLMGSDAPIGIGDSGNGRFVFLALDIAESVELAGLVKGIVNAVSLLFSTDKAKIDPSVVDAKRLVPAFGTLKCKGAAGITERPHRRTGFACAEHVARLGLEDLRVLLEALRGDMSPEHNAAIDKVMGIKPAPRSPTNGAAAAATRSAGQVDDPFARANACAIADVARFAGKIDGDDPICPGCDTSGDSSVNFYENGLKCLHGRCANKGRNGFRTPVDLVMEATGNTAKEAAAQILEWFGLPGFPERRHEASGPAEATEPAEVTEEDDPEREAIRAEGAAQEVPTSSDPLRGLQHLGPLAIVGRRRLLELASTPVRYVWQDIAVAGTIVLVAGPPAEGKTTLLFLILAARMNTGHAVTLLGRHIDPAPVDKWIVLIEGEHSEASAARKLTRSTWLLGIDDDALDRVILVARKAVRLNSPQWDDVRKLVAAGLVSDIGIDTVARVAPADADNEAQQVAIFDLVARTIDAAPVGQDGPIVWGVAHTRKGGSSELADVSGSVQRVGQADSVLLISGEKSGGRTVSTRVTFAKLREEPDDYPRPVTFSIVGKGEDRELMLGGAPSAAEDNDPSGHPLEARIMDELRTGPKTKTALRTALRRNARDIESAISNLLTRRSIATAEVWVGGRKHDGVELLASNVPSDVRAPDSGATYRAPDERRTPKEDR